MQQNIISDERGRGRLAILSVFSDQGGMRGRPILVLADKGGRGDCKPQFLADIICEQPLMSHAKIAKFPAVIFFARMPKNGVPCA